MQSLPFHMSVVASLQNRCIMGELWYTPVRKLGELPLGHRQVGCC